MLREALRGKMKVICNRHNKCSVKGCPHGGKHEFDPDEYTEDDRTCIEPGTCPVANEETYCREALESDPEVDISVKGPDYWDDMKNE